MYFDKDEKKLANILVNYSCAIKRGEKVMIEVTETPDNFLSAIIDEVFKAGAFPFVYRHSTEIKKQIVLNCSKEYATIRKEIELPVMKKMDAYIAVRGVQNSFEMSDVNTELIKIMHKNYLEPIVEERVNNTKWVILNYPTPSFAQQAGLSTEAFRNFFFLVCNLDYGKMDKAMDALVALMNKTDKVHIKGKNTDLTFSIKNIPSIKCAGKMNIPDGEVFTAPVKNSVNGKVFFTVPTIYDGKKFDDCYLEFKDGKIIKATSSNTAAMNFILDSDEGARYVGEFAFGVNPYIKKPMLDILFDEKMFGSFHFTPGRCYEEANNTNQSCIHWDMVCSQTEEYGGGEIYFDNVLIRKNGLFVLEQLKPLNFEEESAVLPSANKH